MDLYLRLFRECPDDVLPSDTEGLGVAFLRSGRRREAEECLSSLPPDTRKGSILELELALDGGDYRRATGILLEGLDIQNRQISQLWGRGRAAVIESYLDSEEKLKEQEIRYHRTILWAVVAVGATVIIFLLILLWIRRIGNRNRLSEALEDNPELREWLVSYLQLNLSPDRVGEINSLLGAFYDEERSADGEAASTKAKKSFLESFRMLLKQTGPESGFAEYIIRRADGKGVVSRFRKDFPDADSKEVYLLALVASGFSGSASGVLLGISRENYYKRKSELKSRIMESAVADKTPYEHLFRL